MATEMTKTAAQPSVLDLLLSGDIPNVEKELPTAAYKIDRLSDLAGHDVVFKLKALPYGKVHDIERFTQDTEVHILLAGCVEPNLKDERLLEKFGGATPADAVKKMLLAGEITDLAQVIERLSGYRRLTITEVKTSDGRQRPGIRLAILPVFCSPLGPRRSSGTLGRRHRLA